jgi:hypothetical protein
MRSSHWPIQDALILTKDLFCCLKKTLLLGKLKLLLELHTGVFVSYHAKEYWTAE